jgi:hypothetical protein
MAVQTSPQIEQTFGYGNVYPVRCGTIRGDKSNSVCPEVDAPVVGCDDVIDIFANDPVGVATVVKTSSSLNSLPGIPAIIDIVA